MELTREQAEARLNSPNNLANKIEQFRNKRKLSVDIFRVSEEKEPQIVAHVNPGRQLPRLTTEAKKEIVARCETGEETQREIAERFGVTQGAVSYLKREHEREEEHSKSNEQRAKEQRAKDIAIDKMMLAMGLITEEKLEKMKVKDLAYTVSHIASVSNAMTSKEHDKSALVNLIVYSPEVRSEESYKVIEIGPSQGS